MADLEGRVAIVTGASSGIGANAAQALAAAGLAVYGLSRTGATGAPFVHVPCDVRDSTAVAAAVAQVMGKAGRIDVVVNAAGVSLPEPRETEAVDDELWRSVLDTNLDGTFYVCRAVLPAMKKAGRGYIINILSTASFRANAANGPYSASKYGARALTESLAAELKGTGVRVTSISPGPVDTHIWNHKVKPPTDQDRGLMLQAADISQIALFLLGLPDRVLIDNITVTPAFWPR
jgi:NADP-dependent 3-hydroxy acid dehydrogenase YdfG